MIKAAALIVAFLTLAVAPAQCFDPQGRDPSAADGTTSPELLRLSTQDPPKCGTLTAEDLKAAGIDRVMETTCMKELHLFALLGKERGYGSLTVVVSPAEDALAKKAYEDDVKDYKGLGKDNFKEENLFGEKSYWAKVDDGFILGFLKGKRYFKFGGGGETPEEKKESEAVIRKLAKACAARP